MSYSGMWKQQAYRDPARVPHSLDPGHGITDAPDPDALTYATPPMPEVDSGEYPGMDVYVRLPGVIVDNTPDTHSDVNQPNTRSELEMVRDSHVVHAQDYGASRAQALGTHHVVFFDEKQVHTVVEGFTAGSTSVNPVAQARGLNGLPENNPEGFRPGETHLWRYDRKFQTGERRHDERPVTLNLAYQPGNAPPPPPDRFTTSNSPFGSLATPITRYFQRPTMRREPTPLSQGIVADDAGSQSEPIGGDWVM